MMDEDGDTVMVLVAAMQMFDDEDDDSSAKEDDEEIYSDGETDEDEEGMDTFSSMVSMEIDDTWQSAAGSRPSPPNYCWETHIDDYNEAYFLIMFRFTRAEIIRLVAVFQVPHRVPSRAINRYNVSGFMGMCILLRRLAYPARLIEMYYVLGYGYSEGCVSRVFNWMVLFLVNRASRVLRFDSPRLQASIPRFAEAIHAKGAPLDCVWGFIDGTIREICRPELAQRLYYSGHKRIHGIKFQTVVTPDGIIAHVYGPLEGRRHDMIMVVISSLRLRFVATPCDLPSVVVSSFPSGVVGGYCAPGLPVLSSTRALCSPGCCCSS